MSIAYLDFITANQSDRADNLMVGTKRRQIDQNCKDISRRISSVSYRNKFLFSISFLTFKVEFISEHALDKLILLWTANTERFADVISGLNDTDEKLMHSINNDASEVSPSTLFAVASVLEGVCNFCPINNITFERTL